MIIYFKKIATLNLHFKKNPHSLKKLKQNIISANININMRIQKIKD